MTKEERVISKMTWLLETSLEGSSKPAGGFNVGYRVALETVRDWLKDESLLDEYIEITKELIKENCKK